ncbi:hypothetical protein [Selenomonas sp. AE3005]|uniref:hypothetical protein n=1 Tax=Selenomonas sp. AE3005 TaxID=1485543 RepID=UPI0025D1355F|nr:hypothetical protein [Selenomonas sp. AE3005]
MPRKIPDISSKAIDDLLSGRDKTTYTPEEIRAGVEAYDRIMNDFSWEEPRLLKNIIESDKRTVVFNGGCVQPKEQTAMLTVKEMKTLTEQAIQIGKMLSKRDE